MEDFVRQMKEDLFHDLPVKPLTKRLAVNLLFDLPLSPPEIVDFGIDSDTHYYALRAVLKANDEDKATLRQFLPELDAAYGHGAKLNALVKRYAPAYAEQVRFWTSWDGIMGRTDEDPLQSG